MKSLLKTLSCIVLLTSATSFTTFANTNTPKNQTSFNELASDLNESNFTSDTKNKINFVKNIIDSNGILINNGQYVLLYETNIISTLSDSELQYLEQCISFFNDGLSLKLFELSSDNAIIPSKNYLNNYI